MYINLAEEFLETNSHNTKEEMIRCLSVCENGSIILGNHVEQEKKFYTIGVYLGSNSNKYGIGVITEEHGLIPHVVPLLSTSILIVGYNNKVTFIDYCKRTVLNEVVLGSLFFRFIHLPEDDVLLVLHELGVVSVDKQGNKKWTYVGDVIENYQLEEGVLTLYTMDDKVTNVLVNDGKVV